MYSEISPSQKRKLNPSHNQSWSRCAVETWPPELQAASGAEALSGGPGQWCADAGMAPKNQSLKSQEFCKPVDDMLVA